MRRTLSVTATLLVLGASLLAGAGAGVAGRALTRTTAPAADTSGATGSTDAAGSGFLGAADLLAAGDFGGIGWHDAVLDGEGNGEPQFAYSCQRQALSATGYPTGVISASWVRRHTLSAAETVAQLENLPQARSLFARLTRWYDVCTAGSGARTPSALVGTVHAAQGEARVWRVARAGDPRPTYAIVARSHARIALVDLYSDRTPPDPAGLGDLARRVLERLG